MSDASGRRVGLPNPPDGRQGFGGWSGVERRLHINVKELLVPLLFLRSNPIPEGTAPLLRDGQHGRGPLSRPPRDIQIRPSVFPFRSRFRPVGPFPPSIPSARFLPGVENVWADALSGFRGSSVDWQLRPERFGGSLSAVGHSGGGPLRVPAALPNYRPF
ncbi:hypothetical protein GWK47_011159 [Chionoecetes opilio]|uniref:Uncharacterized protein n=1 Tax=Chionoecetes opilio TaxID=41210 RepID=A0A8J5CMM2_CHIOP|nr:hypothetical protein GWK47_011159 [Chionoecetes opilio]